MDTAIPRGSFPSQRDGQGRGQRRIERPGPRDNKQQERGGSWERDRQTKRQTNKELDRQRDRQPGTGQQARGSRQSGTGPGVPGWAAEGPCPSASGGVPAGSSGSLGPPAHCACISILPGPSPSVSLSVPSQLLFLSQAIFLPCPSRSLSGRFRLFLWALGGGYRNWASPPGMNRREAPKTAERKGKARAVGTVSPGLARLTQ